MEKLPDETSDAQAEIVDWNSDDPRIIVRDQAATAAFMVNGSLVIRQRDTLGEESTICIEAPAITAFIHGLIHLTRPDADAGRPALRLISGEEGS
jgi:hypothetical protein